MYLIHVNVIFNTCQCSINTCQCSINTCQCYTSEEMGEHQEQRLLTDTEIADISGVFGSFESTVFELLREVLRTDAWVDQPHLTQILSGPLMRLCARYLYVEKKRGYAVNPVGGCSSHVVVI